MEDRKAAGKKKLAIVGEVCYIVPGDEGCTEYRMPSFTFLRAAIAGPKSESGACLCRPRAANPRPLAGMRQRSRRKGEMI